MTRLAVGGGSDDLQVRLGGQKHLEGGDE